MISILSSLWNVIQREWWRVTHKPIYLIGMLVIPVGSMLILMSIMSRGLPQSLPLAIVDEDNTSSSRAIVRNIDAFEQVSVECITPSFQEAREAMQKGEVFGIMLIPKDFYSDLISGRRPVIESYTNGAYLMAGSLLFKDMRVMGELATGKVILENGNARGQQLDKIMGRALPISVNTQIIGNPWLNYSIYLNSNLIPGILSLLIMQITAFSIGIEIKERSAGRWLHYAKGSIHIALLGKLMVHTLIYMITTVICFITMYGISGFPLSSGLSRMLLAIFLLIIASEALGVFFVTLLPVLRLSLSLSSLFGMLSFSMAGFSFPVTAMYPAVRSLSWLFPLRYYYLLYVDQALNGRAFYYSISSYTALVAFVLLPLLTMRLLNQQLKSIPYIP